VEGVQGGGIEFGGAAAAVELAGQLVGTDPVHALGAEKGCHLLLLSEEGRERGLDGFAGDVLIGETAVYLLLQIIGRGGGAEADAGDVLLVVVLELLRPFAGRADANQQHTGGQRVQRAGVAHLQVLFGKVADGRVLELANDIGRCPAVRLVYRQDDAFRVICDVPGKAHRQGILSILFW